MKMTLMQHFSELRRRVLWVFLVFSIAFGIGWFITPDLQKFLVSPLLSVWHGGRVLYTGLSDGLMIQFNLSGLFAIFITVPFALWNIWAFIAPGLKINEKKFIMPILVLSPVLFIIGIAFAFYVLFPFVFKFLIDVNEASPVPSVVLPAIKDYLSFTTGLLKVFGLSFQLPLVLVLLNKIGILSRDMVIKFRRYAIVIIALVAAILTPPDIASQCLLAIPMWALFEISILFMKK